MTYCPNIILLIVQIFLVVIFPFTLPFQLITVVIVYFILLLFLNNPINKLLNEIKNRDFLSIISIIYGIVIIFIGIWIVSITNSFRDFFIQDSTFFITAITILASMLTISYIFIEKPLFISIRERLYIDLIIIIAYFICKTVIINIWKDINTNYGAKLCIYIICIIVIIMPRYYLYKFVKLKKLEKR